MNVLHINAGNMYGGVETFLVELARDRHVCPDMEPSFAVFFDGRFSREIEEQGLCVHHLGSVRLSHPWTVWRARKNLEQLLNNKSFDIVIAHMSWNHLVVGPVVRKLGLPLVVWLHGLMDESDWIGKWAARKTVDLVIFNSECTGESAATHYRGVPMQLVHCAVPFVDVAPSVGEMVRRQMGTGNDAVVIVQVSRMEAWKGHELFLNALGRLQNDRRWTCWIVGGAQRDSEQRYMTMLQERATTLGIQDRVHFLGQRSDVPGVLAGADIFCQPNRDPEPFGIVFVEAMRAGLPVISTKMGGACEIVTGTSGILVDPGDVVGLGESLLALIASREMRETMSRAASVRGRELCDPHRQIPRLREVLLPLCRA